MDHPDEATLDRLESLYANGVSSKGLLEALEELGVRFSEASLRKYVQLGLLPRSVRVGQKGKHRGSTGMYPGTVIRQVVRIKAMMAQNYTIEQIQRDFLFVESDLQKLELSINTIFRTLGEVLRQRSRHGYAEDVAREIDGARSVGRDLIHRLSAIEARLVMRARLSRLPSAS